MNTFLDHSNKKIRLFLGNVTEPLTVPKLSRYLSKYGEIETCEIITDPTTLAYKGYGFVTYKSPEDARVAVESNGDHIVDGIRIEIKYSHSRKEYEIRESNTAERKLHVSGLPHSITNEALKKFFSRFGSVEDLSIIRRNKPYDLAYAFVIFKDNEVAKAVLKKGSIGFGTTVLRIMPPVRRKETSNNVLESVSKGNITKSSPQQQKMLSANNIIQSNSQSSPQEVNLQNALNQLRNQQYEPVNLPYFYKLVPADCHKSDQPFKDYLGNNYNQNNQTFLNMMPYQPQQSNYSIELANMENQVQETSITNHNEALELITFNCKNAHDKSHCLSESSQATFCQYLQEERLNKSEVIQAGRKSNRDGRFQNDPNLRFNISCKPTL